jgi:hypothetical protein
LSQVFRLRAILAPALSELANELRQHDREVSVSAWRAEEVGLPAWNAAGKRELDMKFRIREGAGGVRVYCRELFRDASRDFVHEHALDRPFLEMCREGVIEFVVTRYHAALARQSS